MKSIHSCWLSVTLLFLWISLPCHGQNIASLLQEFSGFYGTESGDGRRVIAYYKEGFQVLDTETGSIDFHWIDESRGIESRSFFLSRDGLTLYVLYTSKSGSMNGDYYQTKLKRFDLSSGESEIVAVLDKGSKTPNFTGLLRVSDNQHYAAFTLNKSNEIVVFDLLNQTTLASVSVESLGDGQCFIFDRAGQTLIIHEKSTLRGRFIELNLSTLELTKSEKEEALGGFWFLDLDKSKLYFQLNDMLMAVDTPIDMSKRREVVSLPKNQKYVCGSSRTGSTFVVRFDKHFRDFDFLEFYSTAKPETPSLIIDLAKVDEQWSFKPEIWSERRPISIVGEKLFVGGKSPSFNSEDKQGLQIWQLTTGSHPTAKELTNRIERRLEHSLPIGDPYLKSLARGNFDYWKKGGDAGDPDSTFLLACCYMFGYNGLKSEAKAKQMLVSTANNNHNLSLIYLGLLEKENPSKSEAFFERAADNGNSLALEYLAGLYRERAGDETNLEKAFQLSMKACSGQRKPACTLNSLGLSYLYGYGVKKDFGKAMQLFKESCELANGDAFYYLGSCYLEGLGTEADPKIALDMFRQGAKQESEMSTLGLAFCKAHGLGCQRDIDGALNLYRKLEGHKFGPGKAMAEQLRKLKVKADQDSMESLLPSLHTFLPEVVDSSGITNAQLLYEARMSTLEAHREWASHISGNLGSLGIVPVISLGPPAR